MRKMMSAALAAAVLALSSPAAAQVVVSVPIEKADAAAANLQRAVSATERIIALTSAPFEDPRLQSPRSLEEYRAAVEGVLPLIETTRAELRQIAASLRALPTVSSPNDAAELRAADQLVRDVAIFADQSDAMLGTMNELAAALRTGDENRIMAAALKVGQSGIAILDAQALMFRGRAGFVGSDRSEYAQAMVMACTYEGMAAYSRASYGALSVADATAKLASASSCVSQQVANGQAAMVREAGLPSPPGLEGMQARLAEFSGRILGEMASIPGMLDAAKADVSAGRAEARLQVHLDAFTALEERLRLLGQQQIEVLTAQ